MGSDMPCNLGFRVQFSRSRLSFILGTVGSKAKVLSTGQVWAET